MCLAPASVWFNDCPWGGRLVYFLCKAMDDGFISHKFRNKTKFHGVPKNVSGGYCRVKTKILTKLFVIKSKANYIYVDVNPVFVYDIVGYWLVTL